MDAAQKIQETSNINTILRELVKAAIRLVNAQGGVWATMSGENLVVEEYIRPGGIERFDYVFKPGIGIPGRVINTKQVYTTNDAENDPVILPQLRDSFGVQNSMAVPVLSRKNELLGCFELHNKPGGFSNLDVELLSPLAYIAVLALENAMLWKKQEQTTTALERRFAFERLIARFSTEFINTELDHIDDGIEKALAAIGEFLCVDRNYVFLFSDDLKKMSSEHEWVRTGIKPYRPTLQNVELSKFNWCTSEILQRREVVVEDVNALGSYAQQEKDQWLMENIQSIILVPMVVRDRVIGFIGLDSVLTRITLAEEYISLLRTAGEIFANAIDRKRAEENARQSQSKYIGLVNIMNEGLAMSDADYNFTFVNPALAKMLGFKPADMVGKHVSDFLDDENKKILIKQIAARKRGEIGRYDLTWTRKDGDKVVTTISPRPVFEKGIFTGTVAVVTDITERKNAEESMRKSEQMLRLVLDTIPVRVFWKDRNSVFLGINKRLAEDGGLESTDIVKGKTDYDFSWAPLAEHYRADDKAVMESGIPKVNFEESFTDKNNKQLWIRTSKVPLKDLDGKIIGVLGTWEDITELKRNSEQMKVLNRELAAKNKELESIIYAASHDLRSPLVNIQGFGQELRLSYNTLRQELETKKLFEQLDEGVQLLLNTEVPESLNFISASIMRIDSLLAGLLSISRAGRPSGRIEQVNVTAVVKAVLRELSFEIQQRNVKIDIEELPACTANVFDVSLIFSNLLSNAVKYLDSKRPGKIRVSGYADNGHKTYCVEDNGIGIPKANLEKIFDIFYRMEPEKTMGQGLGLTIVKRIIDKYNSNIWVESEVGKGSKFCFSLPR